MNTGVQRSGATPPAARTATTQAVGPRAGQRVRPGQERAADRDGARDPVRRDRDRRRAARPRGEGRDARWSSAARATCTCSCPARSAGAAPRRTRSGSRGSPRRPASSPCSRRETARSPASRRSAASVPVEEYLRPQQRFAHLFGDPGRARRDRAHPGAAPTATSRASGSLGEARSVVMDKPFAITLDVGSSLANKTGSWRDERPLYVHRLPPCNHACPAGENIQQWLYHAESGDYEAAWRDARRGQPAARRDGARLLPPVRDRLQPRAARRGGRHQRASSGSSATRRSARGWKLAGRRAADRQARARRRRRARPGCRPRYHLALRRARGHDPRGRPEAGGMMRFGIPRYRLPRDVLDAEIQRILDLGVTLELNTQGRPTSATAMARGRLRRGRSSPSARTSASARTSRRASRRRSSTRSACCAAWRARSRRSSAGASSSTAAATPRIDAARTAKRLGAEEAIIVYRRTRERMPAHDFEVEEAQEEGILLRWLSTITQVDAGHDRRREDGARRERLPAADGRDRGARGRLASSSRSARTPTSRCSTASRGSRSQDGVVQVGPDMMTGHPGIFAGGDMVPAERTVTVGIGHGKQAARSIDGVAARRAVRAPAAAGARELRQAQRLVLRRRADDRRAQQLDAGAADVHVRRGAARARRGQRRLRGASLPVAAATASAATTVTASARTTRC